jgi:hypothetical protein
LATGSKFVGVSVGTLSPAADRRIAAACGCGDCPRADRAREIPGLRPCRPEAIAQSVRKKNFASAKAKQLVFTGDRIPAGKALQLGLIDEVVAGEQLVEAVEALARRIAANAPLTIATAKCAVAVATSDECGRNLTSCEERLRACLASDDYVEGRRALREKRPPVFTGR